MKKSYQLLSIYLDHKPLPDKPLTIDSGDKVRGYYTLGESYNLFDIPVCYRKASGKVLLSDAETFKMAKDIKKSGMNIRLSIILDYYSNAYVANVLYLKRILQLARMITEEYPKVVVSLAVSPEHTQEFQEIIKSFYQQDDQHNRTFS